MFTVEEGAWELVEEAINEYEEHFDSIFPIYEYLDMASNKEYDVSVEGSKKLINFITRRIEEDNPVDIPLGYEDRTY